jgi:hypothetical protein
VTESSALAEVTFVESGLQFGQTIYKKGTHAEIPAAIAEWTAEEQVDQLGAVYFVLGRAPGSLPAVSVWITVAEASEITGWRTERLLAACHRRVLEHRKTGPKTSPVLIESGSLLSLMDNPDRLAAALGEISKNRYEISSSYDAYSDRGRRDGRHVNGSVPRDDGLGELIPFGPPDRARAPVPDALRDLEDDPLSTAPAADAENGDDD